MNICFDLLQTILNTSCRRPVPQGAAQASSFGLIRLNPQEQQASPASILQSFRFISKTELRPTVVTMVTVVYDVTHVWCSVYLVNDQQIIFHPSWTCQLPAGAAEHRSDILHRDVFSFYNNNRAICLWPIKTLGSVLKCSLEPEQNTSTAQGLCMSQWCHYPSLLYEDDVTWKMLSWCVALKGETLPSHLSFSSGVYFESLCLVKT